MTKRVIIVGAGIGGLVAAAILAARGLDVVVLERAAGPGGKLRTMTVGGKIIDAGPTVLTMRWVFEEIFAQAGTSLDAHLTLHPLEVRARHFWSADSVLDLFADERRSVDAIGQFAGAAEARGYVAFSARAKAIFETLDGPFIRSSETGLLSLIRGVGIHRPRALLGITPFATLWQELGAFFKDERLRQLFGRYATYCGASPFQSPATLMLIAHVERLGVWSVAGGMHHIAVALARIAERHGAQFRYNSHVSKIVVKSGRASGVRLADNTQIEAQAVLLNGDVAALADGRFGTAATTAVAPQRRAKRSLSAVTWAVCSGANNFPLDRHNVFFSRDSRGEFEDLFKRSRLPVDPTVYMCAQDRDGPNKRDRADTERFLLIVNAPATGDTHHLSTSELDQCQTAIFRTLARCGFELEMMPDQKRVTMPSDFDQLFPSTGGALYGAASHGWQASFRRSGALSRLPGLYLAGGSVHPGPGVPMAALSGRMAASKILSDLVSTRRSLPVDTRGGISTR